MTLIHLSKIYNSLKYLPYIFSPIIDKVIILKELEKELKSIFLGFTDKDKSDILSYYINEKENVEYIIYLFEIKKISDSQFCLMFHDNISLKIIDIYITNNTPNDFNKKLCLDVLYKCMLSNVLYAYTIFFKMIDKKLIDKKYFVRNFIDELLENQNMILLQSF